MTQTIKDRLELLKRDQNAKKEDDPHFTGCGGCGEQFPAICGCRDFNEGVDACLPLLEEEYRQGFDDGMKHREFLICPCGCPMRIDAKDYQEKHSGEALTPPTK